MAKTFDNISEASATNYLFLFAQRTLEHQNEPPTPPPLNALGLPCKAICLLCGLLSTDKEAKAEVEAEAKAEAKEDAEAEAAATAAVAEEAVALAAKEEAEAKAEDAKEEEEATVAAAAAEKSAADETEEAEPRCEKAAATANTIADKLCSLEKLPANEDEDATAGTTVAIDIEVAAPVDAVEGAAAPAAAAPAAAEGGKAVGKKTRQKRRASVTIAPLSLPEKITEYIRGHQNDAAQEGRWRTTMNRNMADSFREQRKVITDQLEASKESFSEQREAIAEQRQARKDQLARQTVKKLRSNGRVKTPRHASSRSTRSSIATRRVKNLRHVSSRSTRPSIATRRQS